MGGGANPQGEATNGIRQRFAQPQVAQASNSSMQGGGGFNSGSAQQLYSQYNGTTDQAAKDNLIRQMQGSDNGASFNNAMRQGGNMLSGGPNGQYTYQGGHQAAPGGQMNPYGNTNPYTPGGVTDQVNRMQAQQGQQGKGGSNPNPYQQRVNAFNGAFQNGQAQAQQQGKGAPQRIQGPARNIDSDMITNGPDLLGMGSRGNMIMDGNTGSWNRLPGVPQGGFHTDSQGNVNDPRFTFGLGPQGQGPYSLGGDHYATRGHSGSLGNWGGGGGAQPGNANSDFGKLYAQRMASA